MDNDLGEFEDVLDALDIKDTTKRTYKCQYKKLINTGLFDTKSITDTKEGEIIDKFENFEGCETAGVWLNLLNIVIITKQHYEKPVERLKKYRTKLAEKKVANAHGKNELLRDSLPTLGDLEKHTAKLYKEGKYVAYIVNYLLLEYGVRNMDVNTIITYARKNISQNDNYLQIRSRDIVYWRNKYKTHSTYGEKKAVIKSAKFFKAVKALKRAEGEALLQKLNGDRINDTGLAHVVQDYTYDKLGEGNYFKVQIKHYMGDLQKLRALSNSRGTNLEEVAHYYDVEAGAKPPQKRV